MTASAGQAVWVPSYLIARHADGNLYFVGRDLPVLAISRPDLEARRGDVEPRRGHAAATGTGQLSRQILPATVSDYQDSLQLEGISA